MLWLALAHTRAQTSVLKTQVIKNVFLWRGYRRKHNLYAKPHNWHRRTAYRGASKSFSGVCDAIMHIGRGCGNIVMVGRFLCNSGSGGVVETGRDLHDTRYLPQMAGKPKGTMVFCFLFREPFCWAMEVQVLGVWAGKGQKDGNGKMQDISG